VGSKDSDNTAEYVAAIKMASKWYMLTQPVVQLMAMATKWYCMAIKW